MLKLVSMAGTRWSRLFAIVGVRPRGLPSIGACNFPIHLGNVNCVLQYYLWSADMGMTGLMAH